MIKCQNCGHENNDENVFCTKCGVKIFKACYCPKCGKKAETEDIYCSSCGAKLIENEIALKAIDEKANSDKKMPFTFYLKRSIAILVAILACIAIWGASSKISILGILSIKIAPSYWFKEGWNIVKNNSQTSTVIFEKFIFIFSFVIFVISVLTTLIASFVGIYKIIKQFYKKEDGNYVKPIFLATAISTFHHINAYSLLILGYPIGYEPISFQMGWGLIINIVSIAILFISQITLNNKLSSNKKDIAELIKSSLLAISIIVIITTGFSTTSGISQNGESIKYTPYTFFISKGSLDEYETKSYSVISLINTIINIVAAGAAGLLLYKAFIYNELKTKEAKHKLIYASLFSIFTLVCVFVLSLVTIEEYLTVIGAPLEIKTIPTGLSITAITFELIALVCSFIATVQNKNKYLAK